MLPFDSGFPPSAPRTGQGAFTTSGAPIPAALRIFAFSMALGYESLVLSLRRSECPECLDPFPLYPAFPDSLGGRDAAEYYGSAAPPLALATCPPTLCREPRRFRRCSHSNFSVSLRYLSVALVGRIRARYLTARLPNPPVRPVREAFTSYGSRARDIMGKVHFASSTEPSPWTALRVRWVPLYCFPTLPLRPFAMYIAFLRSDYYGLFDCLEGFGVSLGSRLPTLHPPSHPFQALPCSQHRTQSRML